MQTRLGAVYLRILVHLQVDLLLEGRPTAKHVKLRETTSETILHDLQNHHGPQAQVGKRMVEGRAICAILARVLKTNHERMQVGSPLKQPNMQPPPLRQGGAGLEEKGGLSRLD